MFNLNIAFWRVGGKQYFSHMRKFIILGIVTLSFTFTLPSCMTTKTSVGTFKEKSESTGRTYTFDKGRQIWLFWGFLPLGRTDVSTPPDGNCQIITKYRPLDIIITGVTFGFVKVYSIKVKAKKK